jgi:S-adenosylmethionine hydrolase
MSTAHCRPVITLLTDFGTSDHYVAAMKGVILGICPAAQLVDITHDVSPYAIAEAGFTLSQAWSCFPAGTIHLVVVDPGVGSARRPVVVEAASHYFVGPDNGIFSMVYRVTPTHVVREISANRYFRHPVSNTFHGRDIFAPAAAHLANGVAPADFGERLTDYCDTGVPAGSVLHIDRFGNIVTSFLAANSRQPFTIGIAQRAISRLASNYAEIAPGELFVIEGSAGYLEVCLNQGSAAELLGVTAGTPVDLISLRG